MEAPTANPPTRRQMLKGLGLLTWLALVGSLGLGLGALLRLAGGSGRETPAPPVVLLPPGELALGQVVEKDGVALVRDGQGVYALSLACPHLGCRTAWHPEAGRFLCPCHGSSFATDGQRLAGPAPRGLTHLVVDLDEQGRLRVDPRQVADPARRLRERAS